MPVFEYTALDIKGKMSAGIIDAESAFTARQKLRASKFFPVSVKEVSEPAAVKTPSRVSFLRSFHRVRASEISMMTRQLSTLVNAGFPLVSAIDTLIPQTKSQLFKKILAQIKDSIVEGNSFASSLSLYPGVFSPLFRNQVTR